jgi:hypothetical protein
MHSLMPHLQPFFPLAFPFAWQNMRSDDRVAVKRINREYRAAAREEMTVQQIAAAQAAAARETALREQDAKLAAALASHK